MTKVLRPGRSVVALSIVVLAASLVVAAPAAAARVSGLAGGPARPLAGRRHHR